MLLSSEEKTYLLALARKSIAAHLDKKKTDESAILDEIPDAARRNAGCFVTLHAADGSLRGCIGVIEPAEPLYRQIIRNAVSAGFHDNRFSPLQSSELSAIQIEISVLSVPEKAVFNTSEELIRTVRPGIDGVILKIGHKQSTFLPQVWDSLPDPESFFRQLSLKQGAAPDAWKKKDAEFFFYQAEFFSE